MDGQSSDERRTSPKPVGNAAVSAAEHIASQTGLTLQDWLSRTILENARKSGIVAANSASPSQPGEQSAEDAVQAIARHLERAKAAADTQNMSLAEWLSRAILSNAKPDEVPLARRYRPELGAPASAAQTAPPTPEVAPREAPQIAARAAAPSDAGETQPRRRSVLDRQLPTILAMPEAGAAPGATSSAAEETLVAAAAIASARASRRPKALLWSVLGVLVVAAGALLAFPYLDKDQPAKADRGPAPIMTADASRAPARPDAMTSEEPAAREAPAAETPPSPTPSRATEAPPAAAEPPRPAEPPPPAELPRAAELAPAEPSRSADSPKPAEPAPQATSKPVPSPAPPTDLARPTPPEPPRAPAEADLAKIAAKDMPKPPGAHLDWYKRAAAAENPEAQYVLAELHLKGEGVPKDFPGAFQLFRRSAEKGNLARSQYALGLLYARGIGVARNDVEAVLWWQKAADQGHHAAITQVGIALMKGQGIAKNGDNARKMLERAAEADEVNAQYTLGRIYEQGDGVKKDPAAAMKWFILAAEQAHPYATQKVEELSTSLPRDVQERATEMVSEHYRRFRKRS